jgi:hypothetical protein
MPIGNIAATALLIQRLPQNPETERLLQLTQRAIVQLDQRDPMPALQRTRSRSEHHESSIPQVSRLVVSQEEDPTLEGTTTASRTKTIGVATDTSTPSNLYAAASAIVGQPSSRKASSWQSPCGRPRLPWKPPRLAYS